MSALPHIAPIQGIGSHDPTRRNVERPRLVSDPFMRAMPLGLMAECSDALRALVTYLAISGV